MNNKMLMGMLIKQNIIVFPTFPPKISIVSKLEKIMYEILNIVPVKKVFEPLNIPATYPRIMYSGSVTGNEKVFLAKKASISLPVIPINTPANEPHVIPMIIVLQVTISIPAQELINNEKIILRVIIAVKKNRDFDIKKNIIKINNVIIIIVVFFMKHLFN